MMDDPDDQRVVPGGSLSSCRPLTQAGCRLSPTTLARIVPPPLLGPETLRASLLFAADNFYAGQTNMAPIRM